MNSNEQLSKIAEKFAEESFVEDFKTPENLDQRLTEGLGIAIANYCEWDGVKIMEILSAALEDANFHEECAKVLELKELALKKFERISHEN